MIRVAGLISFVLSRTNELVTSAVAAGADFISVHGRTRHQSSEAHPVDPEAIAFAASCAKGAVPIVANGDVFTREEGENLRKQTGVQGVMSARGLLANPVRQLRGLVSQSSLTVFFFATGSVRRLHPNPAGSCAGALPVRRSRVAAADQLALHSTLSDFRPPTA